ncbi:hypothetical protein GCM10020255_076430 [Rhodococcus baikonurensis]
MAGGDATEGLAHFGRRYDDLATEVSLLEARLTSGAGDAKKTKAAAIALSESLSTAAVIGDLDALARRLDVIVAGSDEAAAHAKEEKEQSRAASTARKEALAVEAEQIGSESTQWKTAGDRLREILDEWKTIRGIDRKVDDALWKRYSKARESFNRRRGAHFAELDRDRASARSTKEELVERAEKLSTSTEWGQTAGEFRDLLSEWKAAGRAPREADDNLWKRFKGAQDVFFAARNAAASERDAEFEQNAVAKRSCSLPMRTSIRRTDSRTPAQRFATCRRSGTRSARCRATECRNSKRSSGPSKPRCATRSTPSGVAPIRKHLPGSRSSRSG